MHKSKNPKSRPPKGKKRKSQLRSKGPAKDEEELYLERFVLGGDDNVIEQLEETEITEPESLYFSEKNSTSTVPEKRPVWEDDDDEQILVRDTNTQETSKEKLDMKFSEYLKIKYASVSSVPKWAQSTGAKRKQADDSDEDDLLHTAGNLLGRSSVLVSKNIDFDELKNLNSECSFPTRVTSVEFHPKAYIGVVSSNNGTAAFFQVDGKVNTKIQSVQFEKFALYTSHFTVDGEQLLVGSRECRHMFYYDMMSGKIVKIPWDYDFGQGEIARFQMSPDGKYVAVHGSCGYVHLMTARTKEWVTSLKMNGEVKSVCFNQDGSRLYSHGTTGQVYIWDMRSHQPLHRFQDEGCLTGTAIAASPNGQYFATGSDSGVVNIYNTADILPTSNPKPIKVLMNLTTELSQLKFNCSSEILAVSSNAKENAVRLVHFPSMTVFSNFPPYQKSLKYITCLDFSLSSGYLALGNHRGSALLYRLKHYSNY